MNNLALNMQIHYSFDDWLKDERERSERTEYVAGEVFAMAGASMSHTLIVANMIRELSLEMKNRPCLVFASYLKVRIKMNDAGCYPDVLVVCDKLQFYDDRQDIVLNPALIVEVLSKSTEAYDRGDKFIMYRSLPSLQAYLLISQTRIYAELYILNKNRHWVLSEYARRDDVIYIEPLDCLLNLAEVYDKISFLPNKVYNL